MDNRGRGGTACCSAKKLPYGFLDRVPYNGTAYAKYPDLAKILSESPCDASFNVLSDNLFCGGGATGIGPTDAFLAKVKSVATNNTVRAVC